MPAIQPARLKIQVAQLTEKFPVPGEFVQSFKDLHEFYSDRTRKPGRSPFQHSLIQSYKVPKPVTRQIEMALPAFVAAEPDKALLLADILWKEPWLECRVLALTILGWLPHDFSEWIVDRMTNWGSECVKDHALDAYMARGLSGVVENSPDLVFRLLESWLNNSDRTFQKLGLRVISPLVIEPGFKFMPIVFNLIAPFVQRVGRAPDPDILTVIRTLAKQSPQETAYFLRRNLALSENIGIYALVRQCLDAFPVSIKDDLQTFLHLRRNEYGEQ